MGGGWGDNQGVWGGGVGVGEVGRDKEGVWVVGGVGGRRRFGGLGGFRGSGSQAGLAFVSVSVQGVANPKPSTLGPEALTARVLNPGNRGPAPAWACGMSAMAQAKRGVGV